MIPDDVGKIFLDLGALRDAVCQRQFFISDVLATLRVETSKMKNHLRQTVPLNAPKFERIFPTS